MNCYDLVKSNTSNFHAIFYNAFIEFKLNSVFYCTRNSFACNAGLIKYDVLQAINEECNKINKFITYKCVHILKKYNLNTEYCKNLKRIFLNNKLLKNDSKIT